MNRLRPLVVLLLISWIARPAPVAADEDSARWEVFLPPDTSVRAPALIAIHEWWGLDESIRNESRRLAEEGYIVLAIDLYRGRVAADRDEAHELSRGLPEDRALRDLREAFAHLEARPDVDPDSIGVIGWCMGGGQALALAMSETRLAACIVYYGRLPTETASLERIRAPVLGHFGEEDRGIPPEAVRGFESRMRALRREAVVYLYPEAGHAFANPTRESFRPEAAEMARHRTSIFLQRTFFAPTQVSHYQ